MKKSKLYEIFRVHIPSGLESSALYSDVMDSYNMSRSDIRSIDLSRLARNCTRLNNLASDEIRYQIKEVAPLE